MEKRVRKNLLSRIPGFGGLSGENLEKLERLTVLRSVGKGEVIFEEGQEARGFYVVVTGRVKIFKISPEGKEAILHICRTGDHFGQVAVYSGKTYPARAEALVASELLFFPRSEFVRLIGSEPTLALDMLSVLSARLRELTAQVESLALKEVPGRLAGYLLYLSEKQGNTPHVTLGSSKSQLAGILGTTPETLSRILTDLASRGFLRNGKGEVVLQDLQALETLAEMGRLKS